MITIFKFFKNQNLSTLLAPPWDIVNYSVPRNQLKDANKKI